MQGRKIIAYFLSVLLFVYFNHNLPYELCAPRGFAASSLTVAPAERSSQKPGLFISRHTVKKEHLKVRYKGVENGFHILPPEVAVSATAFNELDLCAGKKNLFSFQEHLLFKLRGPPSGSSVYVPFASLA